MDASLSDEELDRYARHIVLREVGGVGQKRLKQSKVLVVGAGGLGCPAILYLAAAGVGTIGIVDPDRVDLSNLQRQIAHSDAGIGRLKAESAADAARAINPLIDIVPYAMRLDADNAAPLIAAHDVIVDCTDDFATRFLIADTCHSAGKTLVSAAVLEFAGQLSVYKPFLPDQPCLRCLYPAPPPPGSPTCSETGIFGALAGSLGTLQALEVLKEITKAGNGLVGRLLIVDGLNGTFRTVRVHKDPECPFCAVNPSAKAQI